MVKRIEWIDMAKGIGIILMVMGHMGIPNFLYNWIYSFHMPLFLILSGFVFRVDKYRFDTFFTRRLYQLIVPYITFSIIVFIGNFYLPNEIWLTKDFGEFVKNGNQSALWFLPVLFVAQILSYELCKAKSKTLLLLSMIALIIPIAFFHKHCCFLSYDMQSLPLSLFYFLLGIALSFNGKIYSIDVNKMVGIIGGITFLLSLVISHLSAPPMKLVSGYLGKAGLFSIVLSLIGVIFILSFCMMIKTSDICKKILTYIGKNTLVILGLSQILYLYVKNIVAYLPFPLQVLYPVRILIFIVLLWMFINIINRYVPFIIGRNKR